MNQAIKIFHPHLSLLSFDVTSESRNQPDVIHEDNQKGSLESIILRQLEEEMNEPAHHKDQERGNKGKDDQYDGLVLPQGIVGRCTKSTNPFAYGLLHQSPLSLIRSIDRYRKEIMNVLLVKNA